MLTNAEATLIGSEFGCAKFLAATSASSRSTDTSIPKSAAGTSPKALSALNLPPTLGLARITFIPSDFPCASSELPGSVTKTK